MTDENGETIPETEPAGEEVVPYDDGLGLPDTVAGGGQTPGGAASETLSETPPAPGPENAPEGQGKQSPSRWDAFRRPRTAGDEDTER